MKKTFKNLFFGALLAVATVGALTTTAEKAHAFEDELCGPCPTGLSGYMVASGIVPVCAEAGTPEYEAVCGGNS